MALRRKAARRKVSLNQVIIEELSEAALGARCPLQPERLGLCIENLSHINVHNPMPLHPPAGPVSPMRQQRVRALLIDHRQRFITELVVLLMNKVIPANRHRRIPRTRRHTEPPREIIHSVDHPRGHHYANPNPLPARHLFQHQPQKRLCRVTHRAPRRLHQINLPLHFDLRYPHGYQPPL